MNRKIMVILLIFSLFLTISSVSALENNEELTDFDEIKTDSNTISYSSIPTENPDSEIIISDSSETANSKLEDNELQYSESEYTLYDDHSQPSKEENPLILTDSNLPSNEENTIINPKNDKKNALSTNILGTSSFYINKNCITPIVKKGDDVYFEIFVQNDNWYNWQSYYGWINVEEWFNNEELEFIDFIPNPGPDGNTWASNYVGPTVLDDELGKRIQISYDGTYGFKPGYCFNFTVHFKALKNGLIENRARIGWFDNYWQFHEVLASSTVLVGEPGLNLTKTVQEKLVNLDDDVYFDIYLENNGTLSYSNQYIYINDWFDKGLEYVDYAVNPDKNGNIWEQNYVFVGIVEDETYGDRLVIMYNAYNNWEPGSTLNLTLHFKAKKYGTLENHAQVWWKWKSWGGDDNHEWIEEWGNDSVIVGKPKFTLEKISNNEKVNIGDKLSFSIIYTNTGNCNLTGIYIIDNEYTSGLVMTDYSNKSLWTFDGTDTWHYNYELAPGESARLDLIFQANTAGEKNNTAIAGHNLTNEILNSTNTTSVEKPNETENTTNTTNPDNPKKSENKTNTTNPKDYKEGENTTNTTNPDNPKKNETHDENRTFEKVHKKENIIGLKSGNPILVLLISLISLALITRRNR